MSDMYAVKVIETIEWSIPVEAKSFDEARSIAEDQIAEPQHAGLFIKGSSEVKEIAKV